MRALALTALWAGRLVDGVRRGALSTGVAARSRVLQNLAATVSWFGAGRSRRRRAVGVLPDRIALVVRIIVVHE